MLRQVAFLRGINVGGHRVGKDELAGVFFAAGATDATAFLASGNVVFRHPDPPGPDLSRRLERELVETLGYEVPTLLRSGPEVVALSRAMPFSAADLDASRGKPQVAFLRSAPVGAAVDSVLALAGDDDLLSFEGAHLFWLPSGGVSESDLPLREIERILGPMTVRTVNTLARLVARFLADEEF